MRREASAPFHHLRKEKKGYGEYHLGYKVQSKAIRGRSSWEITAPASPLNLILIIA